MIDQSLIDVVLKEPTGYPEDLAKLDTSEAVCAAFGDTSRDFPESMWVEPKDVRERAEENDRLGLWAENYWDRFTNQNPTHECTCHALVSVMEACWNRQRRIGMEGPVAGKRLDISENSASVWFSCLSIYAEANPRQWGGANCQQVIGIACRRGFLPDKIQPKDYGFKHKMAGTCGRGGVNQSSGSWPGWKNGDFKIELGDWLETAKHFKPLECVNPSSTAEYDSLLINGCAIGIGRSGHSVPIGRIVYDGNRKLYRYRDSYDVFRYDSRAYTSGAYSIITCTQPDDWDKPAGV
jgi:hypothetical protein